MRHVGPTSFIYIYIIREERIFFFKLFERFFFVFFLFFFSHFSFRYTEIGPSEFVGVRTKKLYSTRATHGNKKHGISSSFQLKNSENPMFWFF